MAWPVLNGSMMKSRDSKRNGSVELTAEELASASGGHQSHAHAAHSAKSLERSARQLSDHLHPNRIRGVEQARGWIDPQTGSAYPYPERHQYLVNGEKATLVNHINDHFKSNHNVSGKVEASEIVKKATDNHSKWVVLNEVSPGALKHHPNQYFHEMSSLVKGIVANKGMRAILFTPLLRGHSRFFKEILKAGKGRVELAAEVLYRTKGQNGTYHVNEHWRNDMKNAAATLGVGKGHVLVDLDVEKNTGFHGKVLHKAYNEAKHLKDAGIIDYGNTMNQDSNNPVYNSEVDFARLSGQANPSDAPSSSSSTPSAPSSPATASPSLSANAPVRSR
jgi:hypothetical protein